MAEYIEREETIKHIQKTYCAGCNSYNGVRCRACGIGDAIDMIENAPAADVAPVVHAEWVVCGDGDNVPWMCSHCGKTTAHKYKVMYGKYCPHCWAKMDGAG
jgi:hypothetical protein